MVGDIGGPGDGGRLGSVRPGYGQVQRSVNAGGSKMRDHGKLAGYHGIALRISEMVEKVRTRTYEALEVAKPHDRLSRAVDLSLMILISTNVLASALQTESTLEMRYQGFFRTFDDISLIIFSVEYFLRMWSCVADPRYRDPVFGRLRFAMTPLALFDLLAVLPFYLPHVFVLDLRILRTLRFLQVTRILKMTRYSQSLSLLGRVFRSRMHDVGVSLFVLVVLLVMASGMLFVVEFHHETSPFHKMSMPQTMWWAFTTITGLQSSSISPVTGAGRIVEIMIAFLSTGLFALPAGILASGFMEEVHKQHARRSNSDLICPHCGAPIPYDLLSVHISSNQHESDSRQ